jgi:type I restriction enzyme M protein
MFGGIPAEELAEFDHYFALFPGLKEHLFSKTNEKYFEVASQNIHDDVITHESVKAYQTKFAQTFSSFYQVLKTNLIDQYETINISSTEQQLGNQLFDLLNEIKLIDNYDAYQILSDTWNSISQNLEILKAEGLDACRKIDENTVYKKDDKSKELIPVQDGYKGRIFDFEIVKQYQLQTEVAEIQQKNDELNEIASQYEELFSNLTEDQQEGL